MWIFGTATVGTVLRAAALAALVGCGSAGPRAGSAPGPEDAQRDRSSGFDRALTPEDWRHENVARVEELIAGRFPGVQVIPLANGGYSFRIRGTGSISASNEPLVVIDGVPVQAQSTGFAMAGLNPRDIARIEVLRDAASASMYGMRAANGVIRITTRRAP